MEKNKKSILCYTAYFIAITYSFKLISYCQLRHSRLMLNTFLINALKE